MSLPFPEMPDSIAPQRQRFSSFSGYMHTLGAGDGQIWDEENMCGDHSPVLATRPPRYLVRTLDKPNGLYVGNSMILVDGTRLLVDGEEVGTVSDSPKRMYGISGRVVIWPDKVIVTADGTMESLEATYTAAGLKFGNGTYAEQPAEMNSITTTGEPFPFHVGDAVTIEGCVKEPLNNKTPVIREISEDSKTLRFYENTFLMPADTEGTEYTEDAEVTLKRAVPDLDFVCGNENRIWGCKGDTIWGSKLGDPYNWYCFDGISTDSYSVDTGTPGSFTACCSYLGYPIFFKEDMIFKVYGDKPTNFQVMSSATLGVMAGSDRSIAIAGETLYYLSRAGITAYSGGIPQSIAGPLGDVRYHDAVAGSDGLKYVASMLDQEDRPHLFVYSTTQGQWHKEDDMRLVATAYRGGLYGLAEDGGLWLLESPTDIPEDAIKESPFNSMVEFNDFTFDTFASKYPTRMWARFSTEGETAIAAAVQYDSSGEWETQATMQCVHKKSAYLSFKIHRCDHFRLKLEAAGAWKLWALEMEMYSGDYMRKEEN